ncbi:MAG: alpha/beta hydrolase [Candidatus Lambdaproteobacteria bacterium]|nr:alpha/beta hydrolase [Candidatus Lambdaproteobacteria bacterium]
MAVEFDRVEWAEFQPGHKMVFHIKGTGPNIVLLHGGTGSWTHWCRNVEALAQRFTVHLPDLPGCGDSDTVAPHIPFDDYVAGVCRGIERVLPAGSPFHIVGFSFGGFISTGVAVRLKSRLLRVSLISPSGWFRGKTSRFHLRKRSRTMTEAEVREVHRHNLAEQLLYDPGKIDDDTIDLHAANLARGRFRNAYLSGSGRIFGTLPEITAPMQIIWGENDRTVNPSIPERMELVRTMRTDIKFTLVPAAGHWSAYEQPEIVNRLLLDWHSA